MCRNWKRMAALGLAVLLGCIMPMSTMLAAEDNVETEGDSVSDNDVSDENVPDVEDIPGYEEVEDGEEKADAGDENTPDDGNADLTQQDGILTVTETESDVEAKAAETSESTNAPEIVIKRDGANKTCSLGGEIAFEYTNSSWGATFDVSVGSSDQGISFFYCRDKVTDMKAGARTEEEMDSLYWQEETSDVSITLLNDGCYVIYVKVIAGAKTYYARSSGIVVDTRKPVIKGVEEGKPYPEGTLFQVEDANLDYVLVNEQPAALENGSYKVAANGTSCVIRAKDKAGNEETCSIIVSGSITPGEEEPEPGEEKPETGQVISESGEYTLKAGVKHHLAEGTWKLGGDKSVYRGGNDFYVNADGNYTFSK